MNATRMISRVFIHCNREIFYLSYDRNNDLFVEWRFEGRVQRMRAVRSPLHLRQ